jgi:ferritin
MISDRLSQMLVEQIGSELRAHQFYRAIGIYFDRQSLKRWAKLWYEQSTEEAGHASKIMDFLVDNEVDFDLPALATVTTHFGSAAAAIQGSLDAERAVTKQFNDMAAAALAEGDLVNSGINLFKAEELLDRFE